MLIKPNGDKFIPSHLQVRNFEQVDFSAGGQSITPPRSFQVSCCLMATSAYFPKPQRQNGHHRGRLSFSNALPVYSPSSSSSSAVQEKYATIANKSPWIVFVSVGLPTYHFRVYFINPRRLHHFSMTRFGRKRGSLLLCISFIVLLFFVFALTKRFGSHAKRWPTPFPRDRRTLVYKREDLQRIWQWEVTSGHYPSRQRGRFHLPL